MLFCNSSILQTKHIAYLILRNVCYIMVKERAFNVEYLSRYDRIKIEAKLMGNKSENVM